MKNIVLILLLLFAGCTVSAQRRFLAVAFYNCENFFNPVNDPDKNDEDFTPFGANHYTYNIYRQKLHNIATVIQSMDTDSIAEGTALIGLAEVEDAQVLKDLVNQPEIKAHAYKYVWYSGPDERGINTTMIYNPRYFRLINARPVQVPLPGRATRDILMVHGLLMGDTVTILVNHWPSRYKGQAATAPGRAIAAAITRKLADSLLHANPAARLLIMGDFNDNPTDPSIINILKASSIINNSSLTIYNPFINLYQQGNGTIAGNDKWDLFDQIMLSGTFFRNTAVGWHFYKAAVFRKDFLCYPSGKNQGYPRRSFVAHIWQNGYSDHLPVLVYLAH